ncbi:MAG TPA: hypothetical protein VGO52_05465 [Hyphomonadaceae bacterium]|jgi:hypothetical protein|nr:hypothetical protein [Hyphomonadaceae bacterium]
MSTTPQSPDRATRLASLWKECIASWRDMVLSYGRAIDLMRWGKMRALEHRGLGHWLRDLEALVRRTITSDALTRMVPPPKLHRRKRTDKRKAPPASPGDTPRARAPDPTDPTTWRVSFRMTTREYDPALERARKRSRRKRPRNYDPEIRRPCLGYAFRIEALRRVVSISGREAYVMRYARRMARLDEAASLRNPIQLDAPIADPPPRDPPDHRPIQLNATAEDAPRANPIEIPPWNAKHVDPG